MCRYCAKSELQFLSRAPRARGTERSATLGELGAKLRWRCGELGRPPLLRRHYRPSILSPALSPIAPLSFAMDGLPSGPPPLPFPPALDVAHAPAPAGKRRGRPPGSTNKPRAPGEKRPYKRKPKPEPEPTVTTALGFSSAPVIRAANLPLKSESTAPS